MGDFLSLIIPSGAANIPVGRALEAGRAVEQKGVEIPIWLHKLGMGSGARVAVKEPRAMATARGAAKYLRSGNEARQTMSSQAFNKLPLSKQMERMPGRTAPMTSRGGGPTTGAATNPNDAPLYLQQQMMERSGSAPAATSGSSRTGMPPYQAGPSTAVPPRLAGKAPTLDEVLNDALTEAAKGEVPMRVSGAPEQTITAGGRAPDLQGDTVYTSGNPATREASNAAARAEQEAELSSPALQHERRIRERVAPAGMAERRGAAATPASPEDAVYEELMGEMGSPQAPEFMRSIDDPEWHTGLDKSTPEGRSASSLHRDEELMKREFRRKMADPLAAVTPAIPAELLREFMKPIPSHKSKSKK